MQVSKPKKLKYCTVCKKPIKDFARRKYCSDICSEIGTAKRMAKYNGVADKEWKPCWHCYQLFYGSENVKYCRADCRKAVNKKMASNWKRKNLDRYKKLVSKWKEANK